MCSDIYQTHGQFVPICLGPFVHLVCLLSLIPYLRLHNAQDFAQILYFVGGVRIINRNNVFHTFPDREITCPPCFFVYYCQHAKLNISWIVWTLFHKIINCIYYRYVLIIEELKLSSVVLLCTCKYLPLIDTKIN